MSERKQGDYPKYILGYCEKQQDIWIHLLVPHTNKGYTVSKQPIAFHNIPECTWDNHPAFAQTLLTRSSPRHRIFTEKMVASTSPSDLEQIPRQQFHFTKTFQAAPIWKLFPVPGQKSTFFGADWHPETSDIYGWWSLYSGQGTIHIKAAKSQRAKLTLILASTIDDDQIWITLNGNEISSHCIGLDPHQLGPFFLNLRPGTNIVSICSKQTADVTGGNHRLRRFMVKNLTVARSAWSLLGLKDKYNLFIQARLISQSKLFWETYYLRQVPKVGENSGSPVADYLLYGAWENKDPNPFFNSAWYLSQHRDVYVAGINPLWHYIRYGWQEGRNPHPQFSTEHYLDQYEDVKKSGMNPLLHYLLHGILEGRKIYPST
jgi:hypothetical protein